MLAKWKGTTSRWARGGGGKAVKGVPGEFQTCFSKLFFCFSDARWGPGERRQLASTPGSSDGGELQLSGGFLFRRPGHKHCSSNLLPTACDKMAIFPCNARVYPTLGSGAPSMGHWPLGIFWNSHEYIAQHFTMQYC